jgi:hypothetical protein
MNRKKKPNHKHNNYIKRWAKSIAKPGSDPLTAEEIKALSRGHESKTLLLSKVAEQMKGRKRPL